MTPPPVSPSIRYLRRVIAQPPKRGERFGWHHIIVALHHVAADPSTEAERLLQQVVAYTGELPLDRRWDLPHSMSPESMIQSLALQSLARRNKRKHHDLIARVARTTQSDLLAAIVRSSLK